MTRPITASALLTLLLLAGGSVAPAVAADSPPSPTCTLGTDPVPLGAEPSVTDQPAVRTECFETFSEAFASITGVELDPSTTSLTGAQIDQLLEARGDLVPMDTVLLGVSYIDINSGGSSQLYWGSGGCYGVTFGFPSLSVGWDERPHIVDRVPSDWYLRLGTERRGLTGLVTLA